MRPDAVPTLNGVADDRLSRMAQPFLGAIADACASFSFSAHSSQHTSTVLPPIVTLIEFASSLQSQAAQVLPAMMLLSVDTSEIRVCALSHVRREGRCQNL